MLGRRTVRCTAVWHARTPSSVRPTAAEAMFADSVPVPRWDRRVRPAIYDHVFGHPEAEVGGVLVGRTSTDGRPEIQACIPALRAEGRRASVTFTHDSWSDIHAAMERRFGSSARILGWYHSHPGFGVFLSDHDVFIHRNFFSDPSQIAYVVDPLAGREGVFGWRAGEVEKLFERPTLRDPLPPREVAAGSPQSGRSLRSALLGVAVGVATGCLIWFTALQPSSASPVDTPQNGHQRASPGP